MAEWKPLGLSAMHHRHLELGAVVVESDGWQMPARYASVNQELERLRRAVGICDISPAGKLSLQGSELDSALNAAFPDVEAPVIGAVSRQRLSGEDGQGSVLLARLASNEVLVLTDPNQAPGIVTALGERVARCAHVVDISSALAGVRVTGPSAPRLLSSVTGLDLTPDTFPSMGCGQGRFAEIHSVVLRLDLSGLLSYELYFGREFGEYMWDALIEAGEEYSVTPFGIEAMARLE